MKTRRVRWLLLLVAAMFLANNAAAAARACIAEFAGPGRGTIQQAGAAGQEHLCPVSDEATPCLMHLTQSYESDEQKFWTDSPGAVFAPAPSFVRLWLRPAPAAIPIASAPPVGPPLTILFGNLRI